MQSLEALKNDFSNPAITFESSPGGLIFARLRSAKSTASIALQGAQVTEFSILDQPAILYLSPRSLFQPGKPIRGGIPICFPWFGPHASDKSLPSHGFARTTLWNILQTDLSPSITLGLQSSATTLALWPHDFVATLKVTLADTLQIDFRIANTSSMPFEFEEALHTYFNIASISQTAIAGLDQVTFLDKVDSAKAKIQAGNISIDREVDRIYLDTPHTCTIADPQNRRQIVVKKHSSLSTVVWNPWIEKAKALADLGEDQFPRFVCVETCNVNQNRITLSPGQSHEMQLNISTQPVQ